MIAPPPEQVTQILIDWSEDTPEAAVRLMPLVYDELRQLARGYLQRERSDHTLQATGLVHEAYIRLVDQTAVTWQNRAHFLAVAAQQMRRILVDHARRHRAGKRGGEWCKVEFDDALAPAVSRNLDVIALDDALEDLVKLNPRSSPAMPPSGERRPRARPHDERVAGVHATIRVHIGAEVRPVRVLARTIARLLRVAGIDGAIAICVPNGEADRHRDAGVDAGVAIHIAARRGRCDAALANGP